MDVTEIIMRYLKPELFVLLPVLYLIGLALKKIDKINDKFIPLILGGFGIVLACIYICAFEGISLASIGVGLTQGIICAAGSVYFNQIYKQMTK